MAETITPDQVLEAVEQWSLLQVNEFVKKFEEKFDVSAAAPVAIAAGPAAGGEAAPAAEEQTEFTVMITGFAEDKKIKVLKAVREVRTELGMIEARDLISACPKPIMENIGKEAAEEIKKKLEEAGATMEIK
jgi:large subunit ribosomal protein L7/L12